MFRRTLLALTCVVALGAAGLGATSTAEAWGGCGRGYGAYYGANYGAYYPHVYRASYYPAPYYGPVFYRGYGGGHRHHHHDHGGVYFSVGF